MTRRLAVALCAAVSAAAMAATSETPPAAQQVSLRCEASYMPSRSIWVRELRFTLDEQRVRAVEVDGVPVYSFSVLGSVLLTALDNERIQLDTENLTWRSNFRGQATSEGRCERF